MEKYSLSMAPKKLLIIFNILIIMLHAAKCQSIAENNTKVVQEVDHGSHREARDGETDITKTTDYLNKKIEQLLLENHSQTSVNNNLAAILNAARSDLENAYINETATKEAIRKTEQALEKFQMFLQHYENIESMLEAALKDLNNYETDPNSPLEEKYKALMLLLKMRNSSTLEAAEQALKLYKDFKNGNSQPGSESNLSTASLSQEHRKYFEEILKILKDHFTKASDEMDNFLKQILMSPELLKKLYEALKEFSEEDEGDFLWDLWSLIF